ncbi:hypothetical protein ElyMa_006517800 [Elysia marginata]|uniref:Uncharacterized protein n=1 Tax=Elysia marginata TaxID=1093978 RepID=A0AAV4I618_9GAST|nr:hypothetical protein ElyMa_006517800 [Elysia marginata]
MQTFLGEQRAVSRELWSQYSEKNPGELRLRNMDLFQDGSKEDIDVRNVVLQETSQGPMDRKETQQRNYTNGQCPRKTNAITYEAEIWLAYAGHIMRGSS